jgi:hypothetical protein
MFTLNKIAKSTPFMAVAIALMIGILNNWTFQFPLGYSAGLNDHSVLSLVGIQWADPTKFVNDWFINSAPQPHWFFDVITYLGMKTGTISWLYFFYWCCGLLAFGFATVLLAKSWVPQQPFIASVAVTAIISQTPWNVVGSGSIMIAQALPTVLAGELMYLTLVLLLTGRKTLVPWFAALIGIVHVQQGALIGLILVVTVIAGLLSTRKLDWRLLVGAGAAFVATGFGLLLRPIASNLNDFVEVCETIIPYHCAAHTWGATGLIAFIGLIGLALITWFFVNGDSKTMWLTTVGLASFGLLIGMLLDAFQVFSLGQLAQSVNVYRLGVLVIPFAAWGVIVPVVKAAWNKKFILIFVLWLTMLCSYFLLGGWSFGSRKAGAMIILLTAISAIVIAWYSRRKQANPTLLKRGKTVGLIITSAAFIVASSIAGSVIIRPLNIEFMPDRAFAQWGQQVEQIVPSGDIILAPPLSHSIRLATGRAVIVDCKNVPYGGKPWKEWKVRISDLGGIEQCTQPWLADFSSYSAKQLIDIADKYKATYMILDPNHFAAIQTDLEKSGWKIELNSTPGVSAVLVGHQ